MTKSPSTFHLPSSISDLKVALVHDWFVGGGAEKVVEQLHIMFPDAPIYTSYCSDEWRQKLDSKVVTGYLQHWPFSKLRKFIPFLRAHWFSHLDLSEFDLVISSSGAEAKGVQVPKGTTHINYCHAPTHYYWMRYQQYLEHPGFGVLDPLARFGLKLLIGPMRRWDYKAAQRPNYLIANSSYTQSEIKKYYGRESTVIHPPVDTETFKPSGRPTRSGYIIAGRQTPYKRFDLAVAACTQLNLPLTVIGSGPDYQKLVKMAGPSVKFLGYIPNQQIPSYFQSAEAFIFPGLDDFGITPVEALAAGTPVIAYKAGGALDYVIEGQTGSFFEEQTVESLVDVLKTFDPAKFSYDVLLNKAQTFSSENFLYTISGLIKSIML